MRGPGEQPGGVFLGVGLVYLEVSGAISEPFAIGWFGFLCYWVLLLAFHTPLSRELANGEKAVFKI